MRSLALNLLLSCTTMVPFIAGLCRADVLLDETNLVGLPGVAAPSEHPFTATAAEALTVTLNDLQVPAPFTSLRIAVTLGGKLVGSAGVDATHMAAVAVPAAAGVYVLRVIGAPDAAQGIGAFGVCVTRNSDPTPRPCVTGYSFSGNLTTPATPSTTPSSSLRTNFTATVTGTYQVTLTDDVFPVALQKISGGISNASGPVSAIGAGTTPVALTGGTSYTLIIGALADATVQAGLYGIRIADPSGTSVFERTLPVGKMSASTVVNNATAQPLTVNLSDLAYPAPLAGVGVSVTAGATSLVKLTAPGALSNIAAPAGSLEVWQYALAAGTPGVYALKLAGAAATLLSSTQVVNPANTPGSTAATQSFGFIATLPAAGSYNLAVNDFQFPSMLQALNYSVAQNGTLIQRSANGDFAAAQGVAIVLVNAQPPLSGNGLFGVTLAGSGASPQVILDQTQAVGGVFIARNIILGTSGSYDVTLTDLGYPTNFQNLAVVVSRGGKVLGKIYGGGTFQVNATPGQYELSFVATPGDQKYGLFSIRMASSAPTVTFTAGSLSVPAGQTVQLTWSSQGATSCTAAGSSAWTGSQPVNGTLAVIVDATVNLTLTCTGAGGSASQSVNVAATAAPAKSGGGGIDLSLLAALGAFVAWRFRGMLRSGKRLSVRVLDER